MCDGCTFKQSKGECTVALPDQTLGTPCSIVCDNPEVHPAPNFMTYYEGCRKEFSGEQARVMRCVAEVYDAPLPIPEPIKIPIIEGPRPADLLPTP